MPRKSKNQTRSMPANKARWAHKKVLVDVNCIDTDEVADALSVSSYTNTEHPESRTDQSNKKILKKKNKMKLVLNAKNSPQRLVKEQSNSISAPENKYQQKKLDFTGGKLAPELIDLETVPYRKSLVCSITVKQFLDKLLNFELIELPCVHYLIGSSNIDALLAHNFDFLESHKRFLSAPKVTIGKWAENAYEKRHKFSEKQPRGRSYRFPFICATGDFVSKGKNAVYVEIKSSEKHYFSGFYNRRNLLQIITTMTILGHTKGKLIGYKRYFNGETHEISKHVVVNIVLEKNIFDIQVFKNMLIDSYVEFLRAYFKVINLSYTDDDLLLINKKLQERADLPERRMDLDCSKLDTSCRYYASRINKINLYKEKIRKQFDNDELFKIANKIHVENRSIIEFASAYHNSRISASSDNYKHVLYDHEESAVEFTEGKFTKYDLKISDAELTSISSGWRIPKPVRR
jgi:hypothetical protein